MGRGGNCRNWAINWSSVTRLLGVIVALFDSNSMDACARISLIFFWSEEGDASANNGVAGDAAFGDGTAARDEVALEGAFGDGAATRDGAAGDEAFGDGTATRDGFAL
jgi:hypothetical protein